MAHHLYSAGGSTTAVLQGCSLGGPPFYAEVCSPSCSNNGRAKSKEHRTKNRKHHCQQLTTMAVVPMFRKGAVQVSPTSQLKFLNYIDHLINQGKPSASPFRSWNLVVSDGMTHR